MDDDLFSHIPVFFLIAVIMVSLVSFTDEVKNFTSGNTQHAFVAYSGLFPETDSAILAWCMAREMSEVCLSSDINQDGVVNGDDAVLFQGAFLYDVNKDGRVVLYYPSPEESDASFVGLCYETDLEKGPAFCKRADFNFDGVVNEEDAERFSDAARFDLNRNAVIELR